MKNVYRSWVIIAACVLLSCPQMSNAVLSCRAKNVGQVLAAAALIAGTLTLLSLDEYEDCCYVNSTDIQRTYDDIYYTYNNELTIIEQEVFSWYFYASDVNEALLYKLAVENRDKSSITVYLSNLNKQIKKLRTCKSKLSSYSSPTLKASLQTLINKLSKLSDIVSVHKTYFELYEAEDSVWKSYNKELALLYDANLSYYTLCPRLRSVIRQRCTLWWDTFPYITYVSDLRDKIEQLPHAIMRTSTHYNSRIGAAHKLLDKLYCLETIVLADPTYEYELSLKY